MPPPAWPGDIRYISVCSYHPSVSPTTRALLIDSDVQNGSDSNISSSKVAIRRISQSTHPACGQFGLFAAQKILARTKIIDYIGEIHSDERPESDYDLSLFRNNETSVGIDASKMGNEARFVNDYRGIADKPNAVFAEFRSRSGELRMRIESSRNIKKGEEILLSYGKAWWHNRVSSDL